MTDSERGPVRVSRRIEAPAAAIFQLLADPRRHLDLDGSGMLRGLVSDGVVTGVGDVFVMQMYYSRLGDYQMDNHVVEFEPDRRIVWEPVAGNGHPNQGTSEARWGHRWGFELEPDGPAATVVTEIYDRSRVPETESTRMQHGRLQLPTMTRTLERLDELCSRSD